MKKFFQNMNTADVVLSVFWSLVLIFSGLCGKVEKGAVNNYTANEATKNLSNVMTDVDTLKYKVASIEKDIKDIPTLRTAINDLNVSVAGLKGVLVGAKIIQIYK